MKQGLIALGHGSKIPEALAILASITGLGDDPRLGKIFWKGRWSWRAPWVRHENF